MSVYHLDIKRIQDAFSPAHEINTPELFVGRREQMKKGIIALSNTGGMICIYGLRGVGKSSVAMQLKLIAEGNTELLNMLDLWRYQPKKGFSYLVQYLRCDDYVQNMRDLVHRIIYGDDNNPSLYSLTKSGEKQLLGYKKTIDAGAEASVTGGLFGGKLGGKRVTESSYNTVVSSDEVLQFRKLLGTIRKDNQERTGLLILIDEFDRIPDKQGFSSIIKACSDDFIKFGIVGIANSLTELIGDHDSSGRQFDIVKVPRMPLYDLEGILQRAQGKIKHRIQFTEKAREQITARAHGFPYFVHLLGREAMLMCFETGGTVVDESVMEILAEAVSQGRLSTIYEEKYQTVVRNSAQRELALKAFSEIEEDEIDIREVHRMLRDLGLKNPNRLTQDLATDQYSVVLVNVRRGYYRFSDPVFKVYARMRDWKF